MLHIRRCRRSFSVSYERWADWLIVNDVFLGKIPLSMVPRICPMLSLAKESVEMETHKWIVCSLLCLLISLEDGELYGKKKHVRTEFRGDALLLTRSMIFLHMLLF